MITQVLLIKTPFIITLMIEDCGWLIKVYSFNICTVYTTIHSFSVLSSVIAFRSFAVGNHSDTMENYCTDWDKIILVSDAVMHWYILLIFAAVLKFSTVFDLSESFLHLTFFYALRDILAYHEPFLMILYKVVFCKGFFTGLCLWQSP